MRAVLDISLPVTLYDLEQHADAEACAESSGGQVFSWKTTGRSNWLEKGFSVVDVLALVVLPAGLPDTIDMPQDPCDGAH